MCVPRDPVTPVLDPCLRSRWGACRTCAELLAVEKTEKPRCPTGGLAGPMVGVQGGVLSERERSVCLSGHDVDTPFGGMATQLCARRSLETMPAFQFVDYFRIHVANRAGANGTRRSPYFLGSSWKVRRWRLVTEDHTGARSETAVTKQDGRTCSAVSPTSDLHEHRRGPAAAQGHGKGSIVFCVMLQTSPCRAKTSCSLSSPSSWGSRRLLALTCHEQKGSGF